MSREAIESFVDEIRDELPKLRRAFATMHALPNDRDALVEAHRLTHSIKGTAALVGVGTLSEIADRQEQLLESLMDGRLTMGDLLRDTLERLGDLTEAFADGLLAGTVPEERLLSEATELYRRHVSDMGQVSNLPVHEGRVENLPHALGAGLLTPPDLPTEGLPEEPSATEATLMETFGPESGGVGRPAPSAGGGRPAPSAVAAKSDEERWAEFRSEAIEHLRVMVEMLDTYRCDLTRWDVLADVRRRVAALKRAASDVGLEDFAELTRHSEDLLQSVLDRSVPPTENAADCLQACVDALEQRLDKPLDGSILQQLHERIDELCEPEVAESSEAISPQPAASDLKFEICNRESEAVPVEHFVRAERTAPESVELDDRSPLSEEMLGVFTEEAEDHLRLIYSALAELEKNSARMSLIQDVRRSAHTIKGAAGSVGLRLVSKLSHRMEDLLDQLFQLQQPITAGTLALLYDTTDALQDLAHGDFAPEGMQVTVAQIYDSFDSLLSGAGQRSEVGGQRSEESGREPMAESREPFSFSANEAPEITDQETEDERLAAELSVETAADQTDEAAPVLAIESSEDVQASVAEESLANEATPPSELVVKDFLPMLAAWNRLAEPVTQPAESLAASDEQKRHGESLRVPLARIDSLVREVGELIINRSSFEQRMADFARCLEELQRTVQRMREASHELDSKYGVGALGGRRALWGDGASLLPRGQRLPGRGDDEFDALEFDRYTEFHLLSRSLAETTTDLGTVSNELRTLMGDFDQLLNRQGRLSRDTQDRLMRIRMLPLATLASKLHRTVRVVASQQRKEVDFLIQGGDTELDKLVLEELADPLLHLLRNAVDHGLETAEVRQAAGKAERATIRVQAYSQGTQVVIRVSDDGAGLNFDAIRETAVRHGLVAASEVANRSEDELSVLLFLPGFSTARAVSEVSGRGVGLDIVRDKVQKLKGTISVESQVGQGTTFTIRLPMTLAVTRALLLHAGRETFAMPLQSVVQILRLERKDIEPLGDSPTIRLGEEPLPLVYLAEQLKLRRPADKTSPTLPVLVVASEDRKVAFAVEKILPGRDIVVKTLGSHLRKVRGLIGATLLGDGSVVPILDAADLAEHASTTARTPPVIPAPHRIGSRDETPTIMVVDDSVSVRRVMTNLLKSAGWRVLDAKDGLDALEKLPQAERTPDLCLLDIEMPRMDGYELLTSLRSQAEYRDMPIVMVTSRTGDKHRQKAMRLGATDYVVKPYQDDELLSLIRRVLPTHRGAVLTEAR